jgi:hypothetical protein
MDNRNRIVDTGFMALLRLAVGTAQADEVEWGETVDLSLVGQPAYL